MVERHIENIAASLIVDAEPATSVEPPAADEKDPSDVTIDAQGDENSDLSDGDPEVEDSEDAEDEGLESPGPDAETGDFFTFKIDGVETTVSAEDLIENFSIDGAARKRLQDATEARKTAVEDGKAEGMQEGKDLLTARTQEMDNMRQQLSGLVGFVGKQLFASKVPRPDASMEHTDPIGYLSGMERWRDDQMRVQDLQKQIMAATNQQSQYVEGQKAQSQREQQIELRRKRPELTDQGKAQTFTDNVRLAQAEFGFSAAEVNNFPDHRGLLILEYVGKMLGASKAEGPTPAQRIVEKSKKTLRPGGATYQRTSRQKQQRVDRDRAKSTGNYKDVAKLLMVDSPQKR